MAFFEVPRGTGGVSMSVMERKDQSGSNVIRFGIAGSVLHDMGSIDLKTVIVKFGFGRDLGKVCITPTPGNGHPSSYALTVVSKQSKSVAVSCSKSGVEFPPSPSFACSYDLVSGSIIALIPPEIMESYKFNSTGRLRQVKAEELDKLNKE